MPWQSLQQARFGHSPAGRAAGFTPARLAEWDAATDWAKLRREASHAAKSADFWGAVADAMKARAGVRGGGGGRETPVWEGPFWNALEKLGNTGTMGVVASLTFGAPSAATHITNKLRNRAALARARAMVPGGIGPPAPIPPPPPVTSAFGRQVRGLATRIGDTFVQPRLWVDPHTRQEPWFWEEWQRRRGREPSTWELVPTAGRTLGRAAPVSHSLMDIMDQVPSDNPEQALATPVVGREPSTGQVPAPPWGKGPRPVAGSVWVPGKGPRYQFLPNGRVIDTTTGAVVQRAQGLLSTNDPIFAVRPPKQTVEPPPNIHRPPPGTVRNLPEGTGGKDPFVGRIGTTAEEIAAFVNRFGRVIRNVKALPLTREDAWKADNPEWHRVRQELHEVTGRQNSQYAKENAAAASTGLTQGGRVPSRLHSFEAQQLRSQWEALVARLKQTPRNLPDPVREIVPKPPSYYQLSDPISIFSQPPDASGRWRTMDPKDPYYRVGTNPFPRKPVLPAVPATLPRYHLMQDGSVVDVTTGETVGTVRPPDVQLPPNTRLGVGGRIFDPAREPADYRKLPLGDPRRTQGTVGWVRRGKVLPSVDDPVYGVETSPLARELSRQRILEQIPRWKAVIARAAHLLEGNPFKATYTAGTSPPPPDMSRVMAGIREKRYADHMAQLAQAAADARRLPWPLPPIPVRTVQGVGRGAANLAGRVLNSTPVRVAHGVLGRLQPFFMAQDVGRGMARDIDQINDYVAYGQRPPRPPLIPDYTFRSSGGPMDWPWYIATHAPGTSNFRGLLNPPLRDIAGPKNQARLAFAQHLGTKAHAGVRGSGGGGSREKHDVFGGHLGQYHIHDPKYDEFGKPRLGLSIPNVGIVHGRIRNPWWTVVLHGPGGVVTDQPPYVGWAQRYPNQWHKEHDILTFGPTLAIAPEGRFNIGMMGNAERINKMRRESPYRNQINAGILGAGIGGAAYWGRQSYLRGKVNRARVAAGEIPIGYKRPFMQNAVELVPRSLAAFNRGYYPRPGDYDYVPPAGIEQGGAAAPVVGSETAPPVPPRVPTRVPVGAVARAQEFEPAAWEAILARAKQFLRNEPFKAMTEGASSPLVPPGLVPRRRRWASNLPAHVRYPWMEEDAGKAVLTVTGRRRLHANQFALPGRRYPIADIAHGRNALARVAQFGTQAEQEAVRRAVLARYPGLAGTKASTSARSSGNEPPPPYIPHLAPQHQQRVEQEIRREFLRAFGRKPTMLEVARIAIPSTAPAGPNNWIKPGKTPYLYRPHYWPIQDPELDELGESPYWRLPLQLPRAVADPPLDPWARQPERLQENHPQPPAVVRKRYLEQRFKSKEDWNVRPPSGVKSDPLQWGNQLGMYLVSQGWDWNTVSFLINGTFGAGVVGAAAAFDKGLAKGHRALQAARARSLAEGARLRGLPGRRALGLTHVTPSVPPIRNLAVPASPPKLPTSASLARIPVRQVLQETEQQAPTLARAAAALGNWLRRSPFKAYDRGGYRPPHRTLEGAQRKLLLSPLDLRRFGASSSADTRLPVHLPGQAGPANTRKLPGRPVPWSDWEAGDIARQAARDELHGARVPVSRVLRQAHEAPSWENVLQRVGQWMRNEPFKAAPARGMTGGDYHPKPFGVTYGTLPGKEGVDPRMVRDTRRDSTVDPTFLYQAPFRDEGTASPTRRLLQRMYRRSVDEWQQGRAAPAFTQMMNDRFRREASFRGPLPIVRIPSRQERDVFAPFFRKDTRPVESLLQHLPPEFTKAAARARGAYTGRPAPPYAGYGIPGWRYPPAPPGSAPFIQRAVWAANHRMLQLRDAAARQQGRGVQPGVLDWIANGQPPDPKALIPYPLTKGGKRSVQAGAVKDRTARGQTKMPATAADYAAFRAQHAGNPHYTGVSLARDAQGVYIHTHRARSKSYPSADLIPTSKVNFVESTG